MSAEIILPVKEGQSQNVPIGNPSKYSITITLVNGKFIVTTDNNAWPGTYDEGQILLLIETLERQYPDAAPKPLRFRPKGNGNKAAFIPRTA